MMFKPYSFSEKDLNERIEAIQNKQYTKEELAIIWSRIFSCIDLTTLEATDNDERIALFVEKALKYPNAKANHSVGAICIYSPYLKTAKHELAGSNIKLATVACGFPSGQMPFDLKLAEVKYAASQGADEIDMVISRGTFLAGDYKMVEDEIKQVKLACNTAHLKVIMETGELRTVQNIRKACEIAISGGADFLKTSTGKVSPAATPEAVIIMLDTIREYYETTGKRIGLKPAGGISDPETALLYYKLVDSILGEQWLNNKLFRIGASRLADKIFELL